MWCVCVYVCVCDMLSHGVQEVGVNDQMLSKFIKVKAETSENGSLAAQKWEL